MGPEVRRSYFPVEVNFIDHAKWSALTWGERGKWLAVRALGERQAIRGTFPDADYLERLLAKEGDEDPTATVARLISTRLLDQDEEGCLRIHDREEWSASSTPRVKAFRERNRRNVDNVVETVENVTKRFTPFQEQAERSGNNETAEKENKKEKERTTPTPSEKGHNGHEKASSRELGTNPRALGTNPRSIAAKRREAIKREKREAHFAYLRGDLSEEAMRARYAEIDRQYDGGP